jgi:hypothetical protein
MTEGTAKFVNGTCDRPVALLPVLGEAQPRTLGSVALRPARSDGYSLFRYRNARSRRNISAMLRAIRSVRCN